MKKYIVILCSILLSFSTLNTFAASNTNNQSIPGWPNYLAMGTISVPSPNVTAQLQKRPIDIIFKYAGNDGAGDQGKIMPSTTTTKMLKQAHDAAQSTGRNVLPVMIFYSVDASGSLTKATNDLMNNDYLKKHYINLILLTNTLQNAKDSAHPYPGTILLNPDFLGMLQQWQTTQAKPILTQTIDVNNQLKNAINYVTTQAGIDRPNAIPTFENNIKGYIQSINYLIRTFGPNVTFGWQENLWSTGSATWIHDSQKNAATEANKVVAFINQLGIYSGPYKPDFIAVDKYERDGLGSEARPSGYAFNATNWQRFLNYASLIGKGLKIPVILWQMPGGHMVPKNVTRYNPDWINRHSANAPDFFFGDNRIGTNIQSINSTLLAYPLNSQVYKNTKINSIGTLLKQDDNYNWGQSNLQLTANSGIVAILWGGGSTTGLVSLGTNGDDCGWLANKIKTYYQNPFMLDSKKKLIRQ